MGGNWLPSSIDGRDRTPLRMVEWGGALAGRGTVVIVHGLGEHCGRYAQVAARLRTAGWQAVGYDQRGHGRSGGPRGGLRLVDDLLVDLAHVIDNVREVRPGEPLMLLGHSMGGLVAARFAAELAIDRERAAPWRRDVSGLVLSSPALDPGMSAWQKLLLLVSERVSPTFAISNGLDAAWVSRDADTVSAYRADPLVHDRITPRLARFIVDAGLATLSRARTWAVPTLLMWAGADRCVAPRGSAAFAASAPPGLVESHCFEGYAHELFNEPPADRERVFDTLTSWLAGR